MNHVNEGEEDEWRFEDEEVVDAASPKLGRRKHDETLKLQFSA